MQPALELPTSTHFRCADAADAAPRAAASPNAPPPARLPPPAAPSMVKLCGHCGAARAVLRRPKTFEQLCRECFYAALEEEVHATIVGAGLFRPGERVAVAASGGKDSTVLAHMLTTLNVRHGWVLPARAGARHSCACSLGPGLPLLRRRCRSHTRPPPHPRPFFPPLATYPPQLRPAPVPAVHRRGHQRVHAGLGAGGGGARAAHRALPGRSRGCDGACLPCQPPRQHCPDRALILPCPPAATATTPWRRSSATRRRTRRASRAAGGTGARAELRGARAWAAPGGPPPHASRPRLSAPFPAHTPPRSRCTSSPTKTCTDGPWTRSWRRWVRWGLWCRAAQRGWMPGVPGHTLK